MANLKCTARKSTELSGALLIRRTTRCGVRISEVGILDAARYSKHSDKNNGFQILILPRLSSKSGKGRAGMEQEQRGGKMREQNCSAVQY
jgi:hypothetical protein